MQPFEKEHEIVRELSAQMVFDGSEPFSAWQSDARSRLSALLGIDYFAACAPDVQIEWEREEAAFTEIRFSFCSEPDYRVPCHLLLPHTVRHAGVMICLQGHSTGMHISLGRVRFDGDEKTIQGGDRDFALQCVRRGLCAVTLEQRGFGEKGGTPATNCYEAAMTALLSGRTLLGGRVWDVMRLIDVLSAQFASRCDTSRIYCMGNSGGGTTSFYAAALEERIAAAMPSCAFCTFSESIGGVYHCACNYVPRIRQYFDMAELAAMIAPRPLVIVSGQHDSIFPVAQAKSEFARLQAYYAAAGAAENCAHVIGEAGHRFYADAAWPEFLRLVGKDQS